MRYPKSLAIGDTIGICAPSSGVPKKRLARLEQAEANLRAMGYEVIETASVRQDHWRDEMDAKTRAAELMELYENPAVAAIIPPWGGEFLMEILPLLDLARLSSLPPKWISGYSDISTLTFALTLCCDMATIHGANLMNMGGTSIHPMDLAVFEAMQGHGFAQKSSGVVGSFERFEDLSAAPYAPLIPGSWQSLQDMAEAVFTGRIIGGCLDTVCKLLGTPYAPVDAFLRRYAGDGIIWTLESCEMSATDICRTLWQMRQCGWFEGCTGIVIGRPDGCNESGLTHVQALTRALDGLDVPVLYDADIGHIPPQLQLVNGAMAQVRYHNGQAALDQRYVP